MKTYTNQEIIDIIKQMKNIVNEQIIDKTILDKTSVKFFIDGENYAFDGVLHVFGELEKNEILSNYIDDVSL